MTTKSRIVGVTALIALVAAFLAGYWPEHHARMAVESEAQTLRDRLTGLDDRVRAAQLHGELLNVIDAVEAMNYGQAQTSSSLLFDRVRTEAGRTQDPQMRAAFEEILAERDAVIGALAQGSQAALGPLQRSERALRQLLARPAADAR